MEATESDHNVKNLNNPVWLSCQEPPNHFGANDGQGGREYEILEFIKDVGVSLERDCPWLGYVHEEHIKNPV